MGKADQITATVYAAEVESKSSSSKLEIRYSDNRGREGQIIDIPTSTPIYNISHRYRKPTFTLKSASDDSVLATACSGKITMRMEMDVHGQKFETTPKRKLGNDSTYPSPAFQGQTLTWVNECDGGFMTYVCLDEMEQPIARFRGPAIAQCSMKGSFGDFEFVEGRVESEAQRDEIVATGLTLAYRAVMNRTASRTTVVVT